MMRFDAFRSIAIGCLAALSIGAFAHISAADSRIRGLQKALDGHVSAGEEAAIERAAQAAVQAGLREGDVVDLIEVCFEGEFSSQQVQRVLSLAAQLTLENLPTREFFAKIEEGVAKRAPADRVLEVAERRALLLNRARSIVNGILLDGFALDDHEELVPDVAEALEAGRSAEEVRRLLTAAIEEGAGVGEIRRKLFP